MLAAADFLNLLENSEMLEITYPAGDRLDIQCRFRPADRALVRVGLLLRPKHRRGLSSWPFRHRPRSRRRSWPST